MDGRKMTADEAQQFDRHSQMHEAILAAAAEERGCSCEAYSDWFTFKRWLAQGYQVQKGQHGIKLTTYVPIYGDEGGQRKVVGTRPRTTSVFCRHQVQAKGAGR